MSRIGRKEIILPAGVQVTEANGEVTVTGPKGTLKQKVQRVIKVNVEGQSVKLTRQNEENETKALHGLYRALIANMVKGVSEGYSKSLEIKGVGYKASKQGNKLVLNLGLSHPVEVVEENGIKLECPSATEIKVSGIDKQAVGQFAAKIRDLRPVEPYHNYGIHYVGERLVHKVGKTAGKGKK
ncbi:MAG TPA: 50S ribosomal protein L6 [Candidatus Caccopulliclostridium gallistercoris]|uniref:Large ribosomal subunit protein uL6 n=1 Tax=Candidatus Caccopulliclostridium gallistercoris TaxID=2840719 RepID=A0A9D1SYJ5_9FIRM|nr:50S ribosomal protein L6 [Candidatus Caccopulliclostridium gallistercoris]